MLILAMPERFGAGKGEGFNLESREGFNLEMIS